MNKIKDIFKNKEFLTIVSSFLIFLIVFLLSPALIFLDKSILYYFLSMKNYLTDFSVSQEIVMVEIDNKTLNKIWEFPLSREVYTKAISNLKQEWALIVWLDIIFWEASSEKNIDEDLSLEMKKAWNVIIGWGITDTDFLGLPFDKFKNSALWYWFFNPKLTKITSEVYSFFPTLSLRSNSTIVVDWEVLQVNKKKEFNYFVIEILKHYFNIKNISSSNIWIDLDWIINIPFSKLGSNEILINYLPYKSFHSKISLSDIYYKDDRFNEIDFKDKIVLIWATADWMKDTFNTPNGIDYWVYVHANALNTILTTNYIVYFNKVLEWFLIWLLIVIAVYSNLSRNNKLIIFSTIWIIWMFIFLPFWLIFFSNLFLNNPASIFLAFFISVTVSNIVKYLTENKNKKKLVKALWEYISTDIAQKILTNTWWVKLEWEKKDISIFFSDIAWFTSISENFDAQELVVFLREYLGEMSNIIMDDRWFINKYEWDAIMALFWVFGYEQTSNYDNCKTALLQQKALRKLNAKWKEEYNETLSVRMWIHFWEAIIWNIWAVWRKMEFTALWDNVNIASRLEGVNKYYSTDICASAIVYEEQKVNFEFRKLDMIRVKWKNKPITIYELIWFKDEISDLKKL